MCVVGITHSLLLQVWFPYPLGLIEGVLLISKMRKRAFIFDGAERDGLSEARSSVDKRRAPAALSTVDRAEQEAPPFSSSAPVSSFSAGKPLTEDELQSLAQGRYADYHGRNRNLTTAQLVRTVAFLMLLTLGAGYWIFVRCPHDADLGCARACNIASSSSSSSSAVVELIHHEMPDFVRLESTYVQIQNRLGLRTSVTSRKLVSSQVCPTSNEASPFLAALSPKVHLVLECRWDCRNVLQEEAPFHLAGRRLGTQRCGEYKSYVIQLAHDRDGNNSDRGEVEEGGDEPLRTIHRAEELAELFAPITTPEEALSFAVAATWGEPSFQTQLLPWTEYLVKSVEDTHVEVVVRRSPKPSTPASPDGRAEVVVPPLLHPSQHRRGHDEAGKAVVDSSQSPPESEIVYFAVNLFSREGGGCPGKGRLWQHVVTIFPNGTLVEMKTLIAKPCVSDDCAATAR